MRECHQLLRLGELCLAPGGKGALAQGQYVTTPCEASGRLPACAHLLLQGLGGFERVVIAQEVSESVPGVYGFSFVRNSLRNLAILGEMTNWQYSCSGCRWKNS
jgi:pyrimidine deaminase RibD-like protein